MTSYHFTTLEYYHHHKPADWYWTVGIIAISLAILSIIFNNILLSILIALGTFTLMVYASRPPQEHNVEIAESGITVGKYRYPYSNLQSFWIEHDAHPRLLIKTNRTFIPHIIVPVDILTETEKDEIRGFLRTKMPEQEQHEPLLEQVMEYIGF